MSLRNAWVEQTTAPTDLPVSLDDARRQCSLLDDTHDVLLISLIQSAAQYVENRTSSRLLTQSVRIHADSFDGFFPFYPLQSVTKVTYDPSGGAEVTLAASDYWVNRFGIRPSLRPVSVWPILAAGKPGPVRIDAVVGYGNQDDVPADIRAAILIRVKEMFAVRGETQSVHTSPASVKVRDLLAPYLRQTL